MSPKGVWPVSLGRDSVAKLACLLQLVEGLEVGCPGDADRRAVVAVAPRHVVLVPDLRHARIVAVDPLAHFGIGALQLEVRFIDIPLQSVNREAYVDAHAAVRVVAAEHPGEIVIALLEGYDRRVEDRVGGGEQVARNDGIGAVTPHYLFRTGRTILPRHVRERFSRDFQLVIHDALGFYSIFSHSSGAGVRPADRNGIRACVPRTPPSYRSRHNTGQR